MIMENKKKGKKGLRLHDINLLFSQKHINAFLLYPICFFAILLNLEYYLMRMMPKFLITKKSNSDD